MSSLRYWVWLSQRSGPKTAQNLLRRFGTPEDVYFAYPEDYIGSLIRKSDADRLGNKSMDDVDTIIADCTKLGIRIIPVGDSAYPERLRQIFDPPTVLYVRGSYFSVDDMPVIAVVGTRKCTHYGIRTATRISYEMGSAGCIIASGLARGIDSAAAVGALNAGAKVFGVLGCGIDVVYPRENGELYARVEKNGALISEYPPGTKPDGKHFPIRNRILSGLSLGTLVVEAPEKSGALITASRALEQGRDVFAVPGNIDMETCAGTNDLIREGALVAANGEDILKEYRHIFGEVLSECKKPPQESGFLRSFFKRDSGPRKVENQEKKETGNVKKVSPPAEKVIDSRKSEAYIDLVKITESLSETEKSIVLAIGNGELHADEIVRKVELPSSKVLSALTMLEMDGIVLQRPGKYFKIAN